MTIWFLKPSVCLFHPPLQPSFHFPFGITGADIVADGQRPRLPALAERDDLHPRAACAPTFSCMTALVDIRAYQGPVHPRTASQRSPATPCVPAATLTEHRRWWPPQRSLRVARVSSKRALRQGLGTRQALQIPICHSDGRPAKRAESGSGVRASGLSIICRRAFRSALLRASAPPG